MLETPHLTAAVVVTGHHILKLLWVKLPVVRASKPDTRLGDWQDVVTGGSLQRSTAQHSTVSCHHIRYSEIGSQRTCPSW